MTQKILYVDDNPMNCDLVRRLLVHKGFECITKTNGPEAIKFAIENLPTLILTDIHMSPVTGFELFSILRSISLLANTPIVAITADTSSATKSLCTQKGFDGFYGKPIVRRELDEIIAKFLMKAEQG